MSGDPPRAGAQVDGLDVGERISNTSSIAASLTAYRELPGVREIPMSAFDVTAPQDLFYASDDIARTHRLAETIKRSGRIDPLIVVQDDQGFYVLEGAHRLGALHLLGHSSLPALVVIDEEALHGHRAGPRQNPARAVTMYRKFHSQEPRKIGSFAKGMVIPEQLYDVGDAVNVLYRSDKLNPTTGQDEGWIDYIHDHGRGVKVYLDHDPFNDHYEDEGSPRRVVPAWIRKQSELTWLGDCLGFAFHGIDGKKHELKGTKPLPELYTVPSGKALLVIQSKRRVLAVIFGGRLGVEHRGIVH